MVDFVLVDDSTWMNTSGIKKIFKDKDGKYVLDFGSGVTHSINDMAYLDCVDNVKLDVSDIDRTNIEWVFAILNGETYDYIRIMEAKLVSTVEKLEAHNKVKNKK